MTNNVFITGGSRGIGAAAVLAFALINARYNRRRKTRTIFSSERSIAEVRKLDEAFGGRIAERAEGYILNAPQNAINWRSK